MNDTHPTSLYLSRALWDTFVAEVTRPASVTAPVAAAALCEGGDAVEGAAASEPLIQHPRPATVRQWCWLVNGHTMDIRTWLPKGSLNRPGSMIATGVTEDELAAWIATGTEASPVRPEGLRDLLGEFHTRWPQMDLGLAIRWAIVLRATGDPDPLRTCARWSSAGPLGWLLYAAGITRKEAALMQQDGTVPPEADLRVLAALRGLTVPAS